MATQGGRMAGVNGLEECELSSLSISSGAGPDYKIPQDPGEEV
jgi:hypothetical protein